nr:hypothetical protein [Tanacetum cinerariifolium]
LVVGDNLKIAEVAGVPAAVKIGNGRGAGRKVGTGGGAHARVGPGARGGYQDPKARVYDAGESSTVQILYYVGREGGSAEVGPRDAKDIGGAGERQHSHLVVQLGIVGAGGEGFIAERQHGSRVVAGLFGEVLGLAGFQSVGQAHPFAHVAFVHNVTAFAG